MPDDRENSRAPSPFAAWLDSIVPAVFPSDAALARAIGAPQSTVLRWRHGSTPSVPYLLALTKATGVPTDHLLKIAGYREGT